MEIACSGDREDYFGDDNSEDVRTKWEVLICPNCNETNVIRHTSNSIDEYQAADGNWIRPTSTEYLYPATRRTTREGIFFSGQHFDALKLVADLLSQAKRDLRIIDGYVGEQLLDLLTAKQPGIQVQILTKARPASAALLAKARAFNRQYGDLSIRTSESFHDRFVILDDLDFYHFGASIDAHLGGRGFMFSLIEETEVIAALRTKWAQEWAAAPVVI